MTTRSAWLSFGNGNYGTSSMDTSKLKGLASEVEELLCLLGAGVPMAEDATRLAKRLSHREYGKEGSPGRQAVHDLWRDTWLVLEAVAEHHEMGTPFLPEAGIRYLTASLSRFRRRLATV